MMSKFQYVVDPNLIIFLNLNLDIINTNIYFHLVKNCFNICFRYVVVATIVVINYLVRWVLLIMKESTFVWVFQLPIRHFMSPSLFYLILQLSSLNCFNLTFLFFLTGHWLISSESTSMQIDNMNGTITTKETSFIVDNLICLVFPPSNCMGSNVLPESEKSDVDIFREQFCPT